MLADKLTGTMLGLAISSCPGIFDLFRTEIKDGSREGTLQAASDGSSTDRIQVRESMPLFRKCF